MDDTPHQTGETHEQRERRGFWVSALTSAGLFTMPWFMALLVGVYAEIQPAPDIAIELYEPFEAVVLQLDPPSTVEPDLPDPDEVEEPEPVEDDDPSAEEEEVPPEEVGEEDGAEDATDTVDEEARGDGVEGDEPLDGPTSDEGDAPGDGDEAGEGKGRGPGVFTRRAKKGRKSQCAVPHPNIREGETSGVMEIDRSLVDYYTSSLKRFMELGYSEPFNRDGVKGFYIGGFGCKSPVHKAGLRRGDVVLTVNGKKTRTWIGVYLMYKKLKKKENFEVVVLRRGENEPRTLRFRVVGS